MSDLFTRLGRHAQGDANALQPLIAPMFAEPAAGRDSDADPVREKLPEPVPESGQRYAVPDRQEQGQQGPVPRRLDSVPERRVVEEHVVVREPAPAERSDRQRPALSAGKPSQPEVVAREPQVIRETRESGMAPQPDRQAPRAVPSEAPQPQLRETFQTLVVRETRQTEREVRVEHEKERTHIERSREVVRAAGRQPEKAAAESQPQPSITRISIGRVEVRTILSRPQPPATPRPAPAAMSLSDYLEKRTGGGR